MSIPQERVDMNNKIKIVMILVTIAILGAVGCFLLKKDGEELLVKPVTAGETNGIGNNDSVSLEGDSKIEDVEPPTPSPGKVVVYVCGQVINPGVYTLSEGSRIHEAIEMAGGFSQNAYEEYLNLADMLVDGCKIYVPSKDEKSEEMPLLAITGSNGLQTVSQTNAGLSGGTNITGDGLNSLGGKVNINTASMEELMTITGIGETRAKAIIEYRNAGGRFLKIEDIMNVRGIKEGLFSKIKDFIMV